MSTARIIEVDGQLVLDDPDALAVFRVVERENIRRFLTTGAPLERVRHFISRLAERGDDGRRYLIVMLCVDDPTGAALAEALMPGFDWAAIRATGQQPWARGLVERQGLQELLDDTSRDAAAELRAIAGPAVLAIDRGFAVVFDARDFKGES